MKAVIFAGGKGTRLRRLTNEIPKSMVKVGGKPIIEWIMVWLKSYGIKSFLITGSHKINVMQDDVGNGSKWGISIECIDEGPPLETGGALNYAKEHLKEENDFFVVNGDTITNFDIMQLKRPEYIATIALFPFRSPYGIVKTKGEKVESFEEKPLVEGYWINGGVYYAKKEIFEYLPQKGDISKITFPKLANEGKLGGIKINTSARFIDALKDLDEANDDFNKGVLKFPK